MLGKSEISITNDIDYLPAVQGFTGEVTRSCGFNEHDATMILLALEEAITNVIKHAFEDGEKATFRIIFEPKSTCLTIVVKDRGLPYEPNTVPEFSIGDDFDQASSSGLGSLLMRKSVDEVSFFNLGREGKELHLTKYFRFKDVRNDQSAEDLEKFLHPPEVHLSDAHSKEMEIRLIRRDEALKVSQLFYRCYGYSYPIDAIYYPDYFAQLVDERKIISVVTVTGNNEIVGHVGLVRPEADSRIAEAGMAATKPAFRGNGSLNKAGLYMLEVARKIGLEGLYGKAITSHPYSQKAGYAAGYRDCAITIGIIPSEIVFKGIVDSTVQRGSCVYTFLPLIPQKKATIYAPQQHAAFIASIYENLIIDVEFATPENISLFDLEEQCTIKTDLMPALNKADIMVIRYGADTLEKTTKILKDLLRKKLDQINLYLDLEHPTTAYFCGELEKAGFFIAGIIPMLHFNHALILQYLNNITIDYAQICLHSEFAKKMLEYIEERDPNS